MIKTSVRGSSGARRYGSNRNSSWVVMYVMGMIRWCGRPFTLIRMLPSTPTGVVVTR